MEYTHQSSWIIPFVPLPVPMLIGVGLLLSMYVWHPGRVVLSTEVTPG